jgi:hypothetical protein
MQPSRPSHQFVHAFSGGNPAFGESFLRSSHPTDEARVLSTVELPMALER